jgi:hypothetical protein
MVETERVQERLVEFLATARPTAPPKPFRAETVIVDLPVAPTLAGTLEGLAVIVKSWTVKVTGTECDSVPLVPVTDTWIVEADENVQDNVAIADPVTRVGETVHEVLLVVRSIAPEKPFWPIVLSIDVPAAPTLTGTRVGLAVIAKS